MDVPATDRLMLWAGVTDIYIKHNKKPEGGGNDTHRSILEQTRNYRYGAPGSGSACRPRSAGRT